MHQTKMFKKIPRLIHWKMRYQYWITVIELSLPANRNLEKQIGKKKAFLEHAEGSCCSVCIERCTTAGDEALTTVRLKNANCTEVLSDQIPKYRVVCSRVLAGDAHAPWKGRRASFVDKKVVLQCLGKHYTSPCASFVSRGRSQA